MAMLQGFPNDFEFNGSAISNNYRHIGDAVPPLVSHQLAWVCDWMLTGRKPNPGEWILADTHLRPQFIVETNEPTLAYA
jgi:DNA (cytosine-5)-methyltransferase 1